LADIYILLLVCLIIWYFWFLRNVSEKAKVLTEKYCEDASLQFIAIARVKTRFSASKRLGIFIKTVYEFEFSGDGESSYVGHLTMNALKPEGFELPPYKV
jgi:hypothetical protein